MQVAIPNYYFKLQYMIMLYERLKDGHDFYIYYGMNVTTEYIEKYKEITGKDLFGITLENSTENLRRL